MFAVISYFPSHSIVAHQQVDVRCGGNSKPGGEYRLAHNSNDQRTPKFRSLAKILISCR